jgi:hypothetical protein
MSIRRLVVLVTFLAVFAMAARVAIDTDTWWHLRTAQWILSEKSIPKEDVFSHTRSGEDWKGGSANWISQLQLYGLFSLFGPGGLTLWVASLVTLTYFFVWRVMAGREFMKAFVIVLAGMVAGVYWAARPYMVTFVLTAVYLSILEDFRWKEKDRLWWLPVLMILWVNSHGGVAAGFIVWGVYGVHEGVAWIGQAVISEKPFKVRFDRGWLRSGLSGKVGRMLVIGLLMTAAVCLNPSGPAMLRYTFETVSIGVLQDFIAEWQSPNFHELRVQPFLWLLFFLFAAIGTSKKRLALTDFLLVAGFCYLSLTAVRNFALFSLVAPLTLARHTESSMEELRTRVGFHLTADKTLVPGYQKVINWALAIVIVLVVVAKVFSVFPTQVQEAAYSKDLPIEAIAYIKAEKPSGALLNSYNWGAYLMWALPEYPVFVDGRTDLYGDEIIGEWLQVVRAENGWQQILEKRDIHLILLEPNMRVIAFLEDEEWELLFEDDVAVVYGR